MSALSNYLEDKLVDHVLRNTVYTPPAAVYLALFTSGASLAELEAGTLTNEVTGGSYARQAVTFSAPSGGATSNTVVISFPSMPAVTVSYVGIMDGDVEGAGNVLIYGALVAVKVLNAGDTFAVAVGDLDVTLA